MTTTGCTEKRTWASESGISLNGGKAMTSTQASFFIRISDPRSTLDALDDGRTLVWHTNGRTVTYMSTPTGETKAA